MSIKGAMNSTTEKLTPLLRLRYGNAIKDGIRELGGDPMKINQMFVGLQRHLYREHSAKPS